MHTFFVEKFNSLKDIRVCRSFFSQFIFTPIDHPKHVRKNLRTFKYFAEIKLTMDTLFRNIQKYAESYKARTSIIDDIADKVK